MYREYLLYAKKYISSDKHSFVFGMVFAALKSMCSLLVPLTFSGIVDQALTNNRYDLLVKYSLIMVLGYSAMCISGVLKDYFLSTVDESFSKKIRHLILSKIHKMDCAELEKVDNGQIMAKYNKETEIIQEHFGTQFTNIIPNLLVLFYCSTFIVFTNMEVFITSISMILVYMVINKIFGKKINVCAEENMKDNSEAISIFSDSFVNALLTKINVLYNRIENRFSNAYMKYFKSTIKLKVLFSLNMNLAMIVLYISSGLMWFVCGKGILEGNMTIGQLTAIISYQGMLLTPLSFFSEYNGSLKKSVAAIDSINDFFTKKEEKYCGEKVNQIERIEFANVTFGYDKEIILQNVSFELEKGKIFAISGPSGCGKSTIAKLLLRQYKSCSGKILCNGMNIEDYDLDSYRSRFSIMSQEPSFYRDSVWKNLAVDNENCRESVVELSKKLDIYDDIQKFSEGFDFVLSQNAGNISGGQKKRLDALRALIKDSDILIFDEGSNGLDAIRKKRIYNLLSQMQKEKIVLIISHDPEDLKLADVVYKVVDKKVVMKC